MTGELNQHSVNWLL